MSASILVPYTSGCEWRGRAWDFIRARYERLHPTWELIVGQAPGEWSKGAAIADAFSRSSSDALVLADADSFIDEETLATSVELLAEHPWVMPHRRVRRLTRKATSVVLEGGKAHPHQLARSAYVGVIGGGITVLRRSAYEEVGGIDQRFSGWGGEDISFGWALETLVAPPHRLEADLYHLWHPHAAPRRRGSPESESLAGAYRLARGNPEAMRVLTTGGGLLCSLDQASNPYERDRHRRSSSRA